MAQAIDFGVSKDEVLVIIRRAAHTDQEKNILPLVEQALDYYIANTDEANEILQPYRIAYP